MIRSTRILAVCVLTAALWACGSSDSPQAQIRKVIDAVETAVEARDVGDVMQFVADDFRDAQARGPQELRRYLQGYFIANQSIHLLTRIEHIDFPHPDEAEVEVTVGMVGRDADAAGAWDLAAELRSFEVTMRRQDGEWKVVYARTRPQGLGARP